MVTASLKNPVGAHVSIAGGFIESFRRAESIGADALQIFAKSPRGGQMRVVSESEGKEVLEFSGRKKIKYGVIHAPYILNFAKKLSPNDYQKKSLIDDLKSAEALGLDGVVVHMGKTTDSSPDAAIANYCQNIADIIGKTPKINSKIILENASGQGSELGFRLDEFGLIFKEISARLNKNERKRLRICLDTAHAFAAGYDLSRKEGVNFFIGELEKKIGLKNIACIHLNDSKKPLGSRVDRHEDIGFGTIGEIALKNFIQAINKKSKTKFPFILETPEIYDPFDKQIKKVRKWI